MTAPADAALQRSAVDTEGGEVLAAAPGSPMFVSEDTATTNIESLRPTDSARANAGIRLPFVRLPESGVLKERQFIPFARWEGHVVELAATYFIAEVERLDANETATAEFEFTEISAGDIPLCDLGALFYWTIGYEIDSGGQRRRSSIVRFRRLGRKT